MPITCPSEGLPVVTAQQNAATWTICVKGSLAGFTGALTQELTSDTIKVKVFPGTVTIATRQPPNDEVTDACVSGQDWCAHHVPVCDPGLAGNVIPGAPCTAIAWHMTGTSVDAISIVNFGVLNPGVAGGAHCCSGCALVEGPNYAQEYS